MFWLLEFFTDDQLNLGSGKHTLEIIPIENEEIPMDIQIVEHSHLSIQGIKECLGFEPEHSDDPVEIKSGEVVYLAKQQMKPGVFKFFKAIFDEEKITVL